MKKYIFAFASIVALSAACPAQILNPGFENWTSQGSYSTPDDWGNLNSMTSFASVYTCTKGTPGSPGNSYVKLISKTVTGMGVVPGLIGSGTLNVSNMTASGTPYTIRSQNFTGKWQYMASGSDQGFISVVLSVWNSNLNKRDTVAYTNNKLAGMAMSWASFSLPLTYMSGGNPDTATIILSASGTTPVASSYLYVDNLAFSGTVLGVKENALIKTLNVYPNPASDRVQVEFTLEKNSDVKLQVLDLTGKIVRENIEQDLSGAVNRTVELTGLAKGVYFLKIVTGQGTEVRKITLE